MSKTIFAINPIKQYSLDLPFSNFDSLNIINSTDSLAYPDIHLPPCFFETSTSTNSDQLEYLQTEYDFRRGDYDQLNAHFK